MTCPAAGAANQHKSGSLPALCTLCAVLWAQNADPYTRPSKRSGHVVRGRPDGPLDDWA